jgi:hypothetical protein
MKHYAGISKHVDYFLVSDVRHLTSQALIKKIPIYVPGRWIVIMGARYWSIVTSVGTEALEYTCRRYRGTVVNLP